MILVTAIGFHFSTILREKPVALSQDFDSIQLAIAFEDALTDERSCSSFELVHIEFLGSGIAKIRLPEGRIEETPFDLERVQHSFGQFLALADAPEDFPQYAHSTGLQFSVSNSSLGVSGRNRMPQSYTWNKLDLEHIGEPTHQEVFGRFSSSLIASLPAERRQILSTRIAEGPKPETQDKEVGFVYESSIKKLAELLTFQFDPQS